MRIGLVCPYNIYKGGGVQECVKELQEQLAVLGHEAFIITPKPIKNKTKKHKNKNILFIGTSADIKSPFQATVAQISATVDIKALEEVLDKYKFDIIHYHEPWAPMLSSQILARSSAVNIATFHAKMPDTAMSKAVERAIAPLAKTILNNIDWCTAVSPAASEYYTSISGKKPEIVPNGINLNKFIRSSARRDPKLILYIGRLEKRKGVKYLLKAFKELQKNYPDYRLIIAGDGPDRQKLQNFVYEKNLKNVEFLGYITEKKKIDLLHECSLYCAPAIYGESFGIVLLEAMASDAVTVAGNNPGYESVMQGLGSVSLVDPKDSQAFAKKIELLLLDDELRQSWLNWSKKYVQSFDYTIVAKKYLKIYEKALKASNAPNKTKEPLK